MISKAQRARLGIFMIAGMILLATFTIIPISFKLTNKTGEYYSFFEGERSLSGLEQGADVKYRGVRIGKIKSISYDPNDITRVKVVFTIKDEFPLKKDMYVETGFMGITGLRYVELLGGSNEAERLPEGSEIVSKPSLMASITGKTDVIINKIEILIQNLITFTNPDSLKAIKEILDNVAVITGTAKEITPDIRNIATTTKTTMNKVDMIASDIKHITGNFSKKMDPNQIAHILDLIDSSAVSFNNLSKNLDLTIRQSREDFTVSLENLRETLENTNELSKILAENPSLLLRSENQKERSIQ